MTNPFDSPFIVPVAGCIMILGLGASGIYSEIRGKQLRSHERMLMLQKGVPTAEIERMMNAASRVDKAQRDPVRSLANARRTAVILLSAGVGVVLFGLVLFLLFHERGTLVVSGIGLVNLCIGGGFLVDYSMQKRELSRFGMEVETDLTEPLR